MAYCTDSRVQAFRNKWYSEINHSTKVLKANLGDGEKEMKFQWALCPACEGSGTMVNPSIDCDGISVDEFDQDPEFAESYFSGVYDENCSTCDGEKRIPELISPEDIKEFEEWEQEEISYRAECAAEMRVGA